MSLTITKTYTKTKLTRKKKVSWKEGTIDNEHMNKKSSKICCIYHSVDYDDTKCRNKNKYER